MARLALTLALICAASSLAMSETYVWNGRNTNFNNPANWQGGRVPLPDVGVSETDMSQINNAFSSFVAPGTYEVGSVLKLPRNGKLIFSADGSASTIIKFKTTTGGTPTRFITGDTILLKDFAYSCAENWLVNGQQATRPPCADSDVEFPAETTVDVHSGGLGRLHAQSLTVNGVDIPTPADLPANQFDRVKDMLHIGDDVSSCNIAAGGKCYCENTCPVNRLAEDVLRRTFLRNMTEEKLGDAITRRVDHDFRGFMTFETSTSPLVVALLGNETRKEMLTTELQSQLAAAWGIEDEDVVNLSLTLQDSNKRLNVEGTAKNVLARLLLKPGETTPTSGDLDLTSTSAGTAVSGFHARLRHIASVHILDAAITDPSLLRERLQQICAEANGCAAVELEAILAIATYHRNPRAYLNSYCQGLCGAAPAVNALTDLSRRGLALGTSFSTNGLFGGLQQQVSGFVDRVRSSNILDQVQAAYTRMTLTRTVTLLLRAGSSLSKEQQELLLNTDNNAELRAVLVDVVDGLGLIGDPRVNNILLKDRSSRRSLASSQDLEVSLTYSVECLPADNACSTVPASGSTMFNAVQAVVNDGVTGFDIITPLCFDYVTDSWDNTCLATELQAVISAEGLTLETAKTRLQHQVQCDHRGRSEATKQCFTGGNRTPSAVTGIVNTVLASVSFPSPPPSPPGPGGSDQSSSGSSSGGLPIIAGAAAGGVLLIAVVVMLIARRRRRNNRTATKGAENRTVVAFENPMYDDPTKAGGDTSFYHEAAAEPAEHEGLYDEPAFNANATVDKANPLYQSNENIAEAAAGEADGATMEEGGYLDVAPEDRDVDE